MNSNTYRTVILALVLGLLAPGTASAYIGPGAGLGAKHPDKRNFEAGFVTESPEHIAPLMEFMDSLYLGKHCPTCRRREHCPDPIA